MKYSSDLKIEEVNTFTKGLAAGATRVVSLNAYPNGVSLTVHKASATTMGIDPFSLRLKETRDLMVPQGRFFVFREDFKSELEKSFASLSKKRTWDRTVIYLGVFSDPFHSFSKKFAQTMACLDVIEKFSPARVVIQSRSKMLLAALPLMKKLGNRAFAVIPFETRLEKSIVRYTPGQTRLEERLNTASGLRQQGIDVSFSVSPILPFGDTKGDLWKFAEVLTAYSDRILMEPLYHGTKSEEASLKLTSIATKLESDNETTFLRSNCHEELYSLIERVSSGHLSLPEMKEAEGLQLKLFAA